MHRGLDQPNFVLKWDNAPAAYGAFFNGSEVRLRFYFAVGRYPLALVVGPPMSKIEFLVERIESNGLFIGHNGRFIAPLGTVFTAIRKTRVDGESPNLLTVDLGVIGNISLTLKEIHTWRTTVPKIPGGHSAGLRLEGDGLDVLKNALEQKKNREYVHLGT